MAEQGRETTPKGSRLPAIIMVAGASLLLCIGATAYYSLQVWLPPAEQPPLPSAPTVSPPAATKEPRWYARNAKLARLITVNNANALGRISVGQDDRNMFAVHWIDIVYAGAEMKMPDNLILQLRVNQDTSNISALASLMPEDIAFLDLSRANLDRNSLTPLSHLTGLRVLKLEGRAIDDAALESVRPLTSLEVLEIRSAPVTNRGLKTLMQMKKLHTVTLQGTKITGDGLKYLAGLPKLFDLEIVGGDIGDRDLRGLEAATQVAGLGLRQTRVTDKGLIHLRPLNRIQSLNLCGSCVRGPGLDYLRKDSILSLQVDESCMDDAGLEHLLGMNKLGVLFLSKTRITDRALPTLAKLPALRSLNLGETGVTDAGVPSLAQMKQLSKLNLPQQISSAQIEKLRRALPQCQITQAPRWPF